MLRNSDLGQKIHTTFFSPWIQSYTAILRGTQGLMFEVTSYRLTCLTYCYRLEQLFFSYIVFEILRY